MANRRRIRFIIAGVVLAAGAVTPVIIVTSASAVAGLTIVSASSTDRGSESFKWVQVPCPAGTHILSGGAAVNDSRAVNKVHVTSMIPQGIETGLSVDSFWATATEDPRGYSGSWSMSAWAVCAAGVSGWEIVQNSAAGTPGASTTAVSVSCPAGKKVLGLGGAATGGTGSILDAAMPGTGLDNVWADVTRAESADPGAAWGAYAYAVCVDPGPNQRLVIADSRSSTGSKQVRANCPSGTRVHGVGGDLRTANGQAHITRLAPRSTSAVDIYAYPDATGASASWSAHAFAICAP